MKTKDQNCKRAVKATAKVKLRMTVDVTYRPDGTPVQTLKDMLKAIIENAMMNGTVTCDTNATVEECNSEVDEMCDGTCPTST